MTVPIWAITCTFTKSSDDFLSHNDSIILLHLYFTAPWHIRSFILVSDDILYWHTPTRLLSSKKGFVVFRILPSASSILDPAVKSLGYGH